jgi:hypothetical protein
MDPFREQRQFWVAHVFPEKRQRQAKDPPAQGMEKAGRKSWAVGKRDQKAGSGWICDVKNRRRDRFVGKSCVFASADK